MATATSVATAIHTEGCTISRIQARLEIKSSQHDGVKCVHALGQKSNQHGEADDYDGVGCQNSCGIRIGIDVRRDVKRQSDELLPEDDPVAGEDEEKKHESRVGKHGQEITANLRETGRLTIAGAAWFFEEEQHDEEHQEHAECGDAKQDLRAAVILFPAGNQRTERASDVYQRVIDGITDRANILLRCSSRGANNARFHERDAECRQDQNKGNQWDQRNGVADRREPRRAQRSQQEISSTEDEVSDRKCAAKAESIRHRAANDSKKPDPAAEHSGKAAGLLHVEVQSLVQVAREHGEYRVVGKPLEKLADIGDPEWALESGANLVESFREGQNGS